MAKRPVVPPIARRLRSLMQVWAVLNLVALAVAVVAGLASLDTGQVARATALPGTPEPALAGLVVAFAVLVGVMESTLWWIFGRWLSRGYAWARVVATVLATANLGVEATRLAQPATTTAGVVGGVEVVVVVAALTMLWSPPMSRYVGAVSRWRSLAAV